MHFHFDTTLGPPPAQRAIFAVDDGEPDRRRFLRDLQTVAIKHPSQFFPNGEAMLESLLRVLKGGSPPLMCFIDLKMPGMCGRDVLRWIRMQDALASVSVVILSPTGDPAVCDLMLRSGAQCCLRAYPGAAELAELLSEAEKFSTVVSGPGAFDVDSSWVRSAASA